MTIGVQAEEQKKSETKKKAGFAAVDKDGDGKVSRKEFIAFEKNKAKKSGKEFDAETANRKFEFLDTDGDGSLSKSEMSKKNKNKPKKNESNTDED